MTTAHALLAWYDAHRRALPWRGADAARPPAYAVWVAEVMLQQTTVATVLERFPVFLARFPDVAALAAAPQEAVLDAWAGLGYYARARNLHACARAVVARHGGAFPADLDALLALPGVGPYTARAVAAMAFGLPHVGVDTNVARVLARLHAIDVPLPKAQAALQARADALAAEAPARPGDLTQALFDLGARVCRPKAPACGACPLAGTCAAHAARQEEAFPVRPAKAPKPTRHGAAFLARAPGLLLLERRPEQGLLGGLLGIPTTAWTDAPPDSAAREAARPLLGDWRPAGQVRHAFTHFHLVLDVEVLALDAPRPTNQATWTDAAAVLPTLFDKVRKAADRIEADAGAGLTAFASRAQR
jgi:A/G-specific adenine glycosylase